MHPRVRRVLERLSIIRPRRGRQDVWAAADAMIAVPKVKSASLSAVVTRADGRVENLGVIAEYKEP